MSPTHESNYLLSFSGNYQLSLDRGTFGAHVHVGNYHRSYMTAQTVANRYYLRSPCQQRGVNGKIKLGPQTSAETIDRPQRIFVCSY